MKSERNGNGGGKWGYMTPQGSPKGKKGSFFIGNSEAIGNNKQKISLS